MREIRGEGETTVRLTKDYNWRDYVDDGDLNVKEKFDLIRMRAQQYEEKARMEEELEKADAQNPEVIEKLLKANELYIESINAKLKLLNFP